MNSILKQTMLLLLLFVFSISKGNTNDIIFEQITNESGRSLGFITGIVQDETGFMWFSTRDGLYRYNGYSYKLFKHNAKDSLSLPYNDIAYLYLDNTYNLWMRHYDALSIFNNEKHSTQLKDLTQQAYDIEVQIVQDKKNSYWIGPTGSGITRYQSEIDSITNFTNPAKTYAPAAWQFFDSILNESIAIVEILNPTNNLDTIVEFKIQQDGYYLIASTGEIDRHGKYDFATLTHNKEIVWQLSESKNMWCGGAEKNCFQTEPIFLKKGEYSLHFESDLSHCCAEWDGVGPNKTSFCGTKIVSINEELSLHIKNELLAPYKTITYLGSNKIKDVLIDNYGSFWALTEKGLEEFNNNTGKFKQYDIPFEKLLGIDISDEYLMLYQDKDDIFWIGSKYGLIKYDLIWGKYVVFQNSKGKEVLTSNAIYSLFQDKAGNIWIGTEDGLNIYNKELSTIQKIKANNRNRLYDNRIIQIFEDKAGNIWVATFKGLNRLIKNKFDFVNFNIEADNQYPTFYDNSANIWYAINNKIVKYSRTFKALTNYELPNNIFNINDFTGEADYTIIDMAISPDKNVWLASDNKISRYNISTSEIDFIKQIPAIIVGNDSIKNMVKQIQFCGPNSIYAFCPNGIYTINTNTFQTNFSSFIQNLEYIEDVNLNYFKNVLQDKKGNFWLRTEVGIYQYPKNSRKLNLVYEFSDRVKYGPLTSGNLNEDKDGNIWFAALPELNKINSESLEVDTWLIDLEQDWGTANVKTIDKFTWIYSTNGLYKFDVESKEFNYYSIENGLVDNNINGIDQDKLGYLWVTSLKGLSKFDIKEETSEGYFRSSDFTTHQFIGNHPNFKRLNGEFIFFTTKGFVAFQPDSINNQIPKVVIDKFSIRGKEYKLDSLIYKKHNIELNYKQNFLAFDFSVLDYTAPAKNRYKYKMEGLDDEWIFVDANNRTANYPGLSPGKYTFRVRGSNNDKVWSKQDSYLNIIITPPWYKTIAAYIAYILLIVSSIWLFIKVREKQLIEEKKILEQKVKERTAEIEAQKEELAEQHEQITEQHKDITDSIQYAQRIQSAILPPAEQLDDVVDDYFILYRPRDIVSGDYYWITHRDNISIIVAADCTGHGVPGAFMSMLGIAFLNEIVNKEKVIEPHKILERLRQQVIHQLHQEDGESKDGMDVSLYVIDHSKMKLCFSGAYNPLYIIRNSELIQLKADRMPIGYYVKNDIPFTMQEFELQKGDCLYNTSDGYPDQFGGADGRKFMTKRFKQVLLDIHKEPMSEQKDTLNKIFDDWRDGSDQIDDVIVIGVRI